MSDIEILLAKRRDLRVYAHPVVPPQSEIDAHCLTHQPLRQWCWACQQAKGRGGQHRRQHPEGTFSIIRLDYALMHDPHVPPQRSGRQQTFASLTAVKTTAGLCTAVLTSKQGYAPHQAAQLHRWSVKYGFANIYNLMLRHRSP